MVTTAHIRQNFVVQLKHDHPRYGAKAGDVFNCKIDEFRHGDGFQMYRTESFDEKIFHTSFLNDEEFLSRFDLLGIGSKHDVTFEAVTLSYLNKKYKIE